MQNSGAYIFRPVPGSLTDVVADNVVTEVVGEDFTEWRLTFGTDDWANLVVRQFGGSDSLELEVEWMIGPFPSV